MSWNLVLLFGGEALGKILAVVTFGHLGRHLGAAGFGDLEFVIAIYFVLNLLMEAGLGPYGVREAARRPRELDRLAGQIASLRLGIFVASVAILGLLALSSHLLGRSPDARELLLWYTLVLVPAPFLMNWAFQARDRMGVVSLSSLLRQVLLLVCVLLLVRGPGDVRWVPVGDALGLGCAVLLQQVLFRRGGGRLKLFRELPETRRVALECAPLTSSVMLWAVRMFVPTIALRLFATPAETGLYGASHRIVIALHIFVSLYFVNLLPSISRASLEPDRATYRTLMRRSLAVVGWGVLPACLAATLLAPLVVTKIYGEGFQEAIPVFALLIWMLGVAFVSGHQQFSLIAFGHLRQQLYVSLAGVLASLAGALFLGLTGRLDPMSAALLFVGAEIVTLASAQLLLALRVEGLRCVAPLLRPGLVLAAGALAALLLAPDSPLGGAALVVALSVVGFALLARDLIGSLPRLLGRGDSPGP